MKAALMLLYLGFRCVRKLKAELDGQGYISRVRQTKNGVIGGTTFYPLFLCA